MDYSGTQFHFNFLFYFFNSNFHFQLDQMLQLCNLHNCFMLPMGFTYFTEHTSIIKLVAHSIFRHLVSMINFYFDLKFVSVHALISTNLHLINVGIVDFLLMNYGFYLICPFLKLMTYYLQEIEYLHFKIIKGLLKISVAFSKVVDSKLFL